MTKSRNVWTDEQTGGGRESFLYAHLSVEFKAFFLSLPCKYRFLLMCQQTFNHEVVLHSPRLPMPESITAPRDSTLFMLVETPRAACKQLQRKQPNRFGIKAATIHYRLLWLCIAIVLRHMNTRNYCLDWGSISSDEVTRFVPENARCWRNPLNAHARHDVSFTMHVDLHTCGVTSFGSSPSSQFYSI